MGCPMMQEWLNSIGLAFNILGVTIAFFYGYPQPSHDKGVTLVVGDANILPSGKTVAQFNEDKRRQKAKYLMLSRTGLGLMAFGFLLQLIATWS